MRKFIGKDYKMKTSLFIMVDGSGSMNEMGKSYLQRNLCRYVTQLQLVDPVKYLDVEFRYFQWAIKIDEISMTDDRDVPVLIPKGSSDLITLSNFLSEHLVDGQMMRVLILSDGNVTTTDISSFKKQLNAFPNLLLRAVAVGADADLFKLKKISSNNSVYLPENIAAAIDATITGTDDSVIAPKSVSQIKLMKLAETEEGWDA